MISLRRLSRVMGALFWTRQIVFYRHHYSVLWAPGNLIHSPLVHVNGKFLFSPELHCFYWMFQEDLRKQCDIMGCLINVMSPDRTSNVVWAGSLMKTWVPLLCIWVKQSWSATLSWFVNCCKGRERDANDSLLQRLFSGSFASCITVSSSPGEELLLCPSAEDCFCNTYK